MQRSSLDCTKSTVGAHDPRDNCDKQSGSSRQGEHKFVLLRKIERWGQNKVVPHKIKGDTEYYKNGK